MLNGEPVMSKQGLTLVMNAPTLVRGKSKVSNMIEAPPEGTRTIPGLLGPSTAGELKA